jgi:hypothetical protein
MRLDVTTQRAIHKGTQFCYFYQLIMLITWMLVGAGLWATYKYGHET